MTAQVELCGCRRLSDALRIYAQQCLWRMAKAGMTEACVQNPLDNMENALRGVCARSFNVHGLRQYVRQN